MKKTLLLLFIIPIIGISQNNNVTAYQEALQLIETNKIDSAYIKFKVLEESVPKSDTLYEHAVFYRTITASHLEGIARKKEDFTTSLTYGLDALEGIRKGKFMFDEQFSKREYFMVKNIIVSHFGLGKFEEGKKWKEKMYAAQKDSLLPEGLDQYFNFDFFTIDDKNIWGYEWYAALPEDRFSSSFTKVVYYVYSTNSDGSDKDQLYRLHVLMFHSNEVDFDYVLTKKLQTTKGESSGTLYQYTYKEDIDFEKLQKDIKEVIMKNIKSPRTITTTIKAEKKGN